MNSSDLLVKCLENEGVRYVFGIPGEENILFLEALRSSSIKYITSADERGAAFMAAAYGRFTGKPGVVATTIGPGALNTPNGLAFAYLGGFPVVALTWQNGVRENVKSNDYQYIDVSSVLRPITKWQKTIYSPQQIPVSVRSAFKNAVLPKAGPAHLEIPTDVASEELEEDLLPLAIGKQFFPEVSRENLAEAQKIIARSHCPLIIAGIRSAQGAVPSLLNTFSSSSGIAVISTPMAQGVIPSSNEFSLFSFSSQQRSILHRTIDQVDTVITVGMDSLEYHPQLWNPLENKKIISIDTVTSTICESYNPCIELIGDISSTLLQLSESVSRKTYKDYALFNDYKTYLQTQETKTSSFPIHPIHLVKSLKSAAPDSIIVHDNGMHKLWATQFFQPDRPNQIVVDNVLASMASGISQAIVAKLLFPKKKVVVNIGDGGLLMSLGELATIASLNLDITVLVWHDNEYGMIRWHQDKKALPHYGVALTTPDFAQLAKSFGGNGFRVKSAKTLKKSLESALQTEGLSVVDCPIDYSDNMRVFSHQSYQVEFPKYATQ